MFLPVLVMVLLFFYWPMLGCRYAFTSYVLANPYYIGVFHFQTMLKFDTFFCLPFVMQYFHIILIPVHLYTQEG